MPICGTLKQELTRLARTRVKLPVRTRQHIAVVCWAAILAAGGVAVQADETKYLDHIRPLLQARCYACHGALQQAAGLRLDTVELMLAGGDSGGVIDVDQPADSLLLERVLSSDPDYRMPPEGEPLTAAEIELVQAWIGNGAVAPADEQPETDPRQHWAFQPLVRPPLPPKPDRAYAHDHPIDALILDKLHQRGLRPQPPADPSHRLRRLYLNLIGVPPTVPELSAYLADDSATAWLQVVDRLLEDPRHGERWARHWMDVWRYSDWYGRRNVPDVWNSAPQVWRWRDWIVNALNRDVGYDQMIREMLAGDEVSPTDRESGYATGFLVRNWYALNPNDWMRANVEHVGKAFLGLTLNCAHCHDHKYDPISQEDYFRFRAFFEPLYVRQDRVPGEADPGPFQDYDYSSLRKVQPLGSVRVFDKNAEAPTWFYTGGDERNRQAERGSIAPGVPEFFDRDGLPIEELALPVTAWYPGLDPQIQDTLLADASSAVAQAESELAQAQRNPAPPNRQLASRLAAVEIEYALARGKALANSDSAVLAGSQSLLLDARQGRRVLQHRLPSLPPVGEGWQITLELRLIADAYFNFQLAKHVDQGLTAALVAFDTGRIVAYQPGSTTEHDVGRYDFAGGQKHFRVQLELQPAAQQALLTVQTLPSEQPLVAAVPIAIGDWDPAHQPQQGIFLDAQPGSLVAIDALRFRPADATEPAINFDFEPPIYKLAEEVVGTAGWEASKFATPPASSLIAATLPDAILIDLQRELAAMRRAVRLPELQTVSARTRLAARQAEQVSLQHRIAAERAKYGVSPTANAAELHQLAVESYRDAKVAAARAAVAAAEFELAEAEAKVRAEPADRQQLEPAAQRLQQAKMDFVKQQTEAANQSDYPPLSPLYPSTSTGRRAALAGWITDRTNPLAARVAVNHIWARHFHQPLVATVFDFGRGGAAPTHPELLDWLAVELIESGWSMKHLHRLIVTSEAYVRSSRSDPAAAEVDPENRLLWRMNTGRMEAEVLRDSLLSRAALLQTHCGGPPLGNDQAMTTHRRSLYYEVFPEDGGASPLAEWFDAPSPLECYCRTRSVVPQQALALTNSDLVHQVGEAIVQNWEHAVRTGASEATLRDFVTDMFLLILNRLPSEQEAGICQRGFDQQYLMLSAEGIDRAETIARQSLVRVLLNHNDFVTIR